MVGAGLNLEPVLGAAGQDSLSRVYDNQFCSLFDLLHQETANFAFLVGGGNIAAPEND